MAAIAAMEPILDGIKTVLLFRTSSRESDNVKFRPGYMVDILFGELIYDTLIDVKTYLCRNLNLQLFLFATLASPPNRDSE